MLDSISKGFAPRRAKNITSLGAASVLMLSQGLLAIAGASAEVLNRFHGRCLLSMNESKVFDGHCIIKHKENQGNQVVVVELDNGSKYRFAGPNLGALQVEAWDGIHNVSHRADSDRELFVWDVAGDKNRLAIKADTQHNPNASHDDSTEEALGTALGAAVGAIIGNLLSGGGSSSSGNNQSNVAQNHPYEGKGYNATAYFKCSVGNTSHNKSCPGGIMRQGNGKASVTVLFPNNYEVQYDFNQGNVTTTYDGDLTWSKSGDEWYIGIDKELFIIIPDAAVYGG